MIPTDFIEKKKIGKEHTSDEIKDFIGAYVSGDVPDYQMAGWLMTVNFQGMTDRETIALVDVMLVLLTIVLTTSTFIATGGIPVSLPKASQNRIETLKVRTVEIDRNGLVYFSGQPVTLEDLQNTLRSLDRNSPFMIRADRDIPLQNFVDVLDIVKNAGFKQVSLQTESKE